MTRESVTPQPLDPPSIATQPKYMTRDGSASWNSTYNPLTPTLPSQHRLAYGLPLHTPPKPRWPPNTGSTHTESTQSSPPISLPVLRAFNMSLARAHYRSGYKRRLLRIYDTMVCGEGEGKDDDEYAYAFELVGSKSGGRWESHATVKRVMFMSVMEMV